MEFIAKYAFQLASSLLGVALSWGLKHWLDSRKAKNANRELTESRLVQTIIEQQLDEFHAQRVFILQRHNGGKYGTGKSMNKLSTTFEALEEGVSSESKDYQNLPTTLYSTFVEMTCTYNAIYPNVDTIEDILTQAFFIPRGTRSAAVFPIMKNGEFVGMVGFEWTHKMRNIDEEVKRGMITDGKLLGDTLSKIL